jgi:5'-deoxynucleotidase YfbR-like HD superfamily hydrolase
MEIQLINGQFNSEDLLELITQMIHTKIKYHENRINVNNSEEEMKYRESKIKLLQKELFETRNYIVSKKGNIRVESKINID